MAEKEAGADAPSIEVTGGDTAAVAEEPVKVKAKTKAKTKAKAQPDEVDEIVAPVLNTTDAAQGRMNASIGYGEEVRRSTIVGNRKRRGLQHDAMKSAGQNQAP